MSDHHWYGATMTDWVVADTKEAVINKLARTNTIPKGGMQALVCKVNVPIKTQYQIDEYLPIGVDREPAKRVKILNRSGKFTE